MLVTTYKCMQVNYIIYNDADILNVYHFLTDVYHVTIIRVTVTSDSMTYLSSYLKTYV